MRGSGADALLIELGQSPVARATVLRRLRLPPWLAPLFVSAGDSENLDDLHCSLPPAASCQDGRLPNSHSFLIRVVAVALGQWGLGARCRALWPQPLGVPVMHESVSRQICLGESLFLGKRDASSYVRAYAHKPSDSILDRARF